MARRSGLTWPLVSASGAVRLAGHVRVTSLGLLLAVLLGGAAVLLAIGRPGRTSPTAAVKTREAERLEAAEPVILERGGEPSVEVPTRTQESISVPDLPPTEDPTSPPGNRPTSLRFVRLLVVDERHEPIPGAEVHIRALRGEYDPAGPWMNHGGEQTSQTDGSGIASLAIDEWISSKERTGAIDVLARHPQYASTFIENYKLTNSTLLLTLRTPGVLIASGWMATPDNVLPGLTARLEPALAADDSAWQELPGGALSCSIVPPGEYFVRLSQDLSNRTGCSLCSDAVRVNLVAGRETEVSLEMHAACSLQVLLEESVPRPIQSGTALVVSYWNNEDRSAGGFIDQYQVDVTPDGAFGLADIPPGTFEVFALCDDWVSSASSSWRDNQSDESVAPLQSFVVSKPGEAGVLRMERTCTLRLVVRGTSEEFVGNLDIEITPVIQSSIGTTLVPFREWTATTSEDGVAQFERFPPHSFSVVRPRRSLARVQVEYEDQYLELDGQPGGVMTHHLYLPQ